MAPILLAAGAVALAAIAAAASRSDKSSPSAPRPEGPQSDSLPLPGGGSLPIPTLPGFPDFSRPGWPTTPGSIPIPIPQWPGSSSPSPQAPPPPSAPPATPEIVFTIQPWGPGDIVRRNFGENIGQLTPSGAFKLRERLEGGQILSYQTQPGLVIASSAAPWPVSQAPIKRQDSGFFAGRLLKPSGPFDLLMFKPFAPSLKFDRMYGKDVEIQEIIFMQPLQETFIDDPIDTIKGWFTGNAPMAYPLSPEGYVVVTAQEAYQLGVFPPLLG